MSTATGTPLRKEITGVVLAGGRGSRLGGVDKGLAPLHGRPLVEHIIAALRPQVGALLISANRNHDVYAAYGCPVIADASGLFDGPLAGILRGLQCAGTPYVLFVPCDAPLVPTDLAARLAGAFRGDEILGTVVMSRGQLQPVFTLLRASVKSDLEQYLRRGERGTGAWLRHLGAIPVDCSDVAEAFDNINTPEQLQDFEHRSIPPNERATAISPNREP